MNNRKIALISAALVGVFVLAGCSSSVGTTPDMFAIVQGNGEDGNDAKVREIAYPGEVVKVDAMNEEVLYFPGNGRNYMIENKEGADRKEPSIGRTKSGTPVKVYSTAKWAVNQDPEIIEKFFVPYCGKYDCATSDPSTKDSELGTASAGWAKMLAIDFGPAVDDAVRKTLPQYDDSVWQTQEGWDEVSTTLSQEFAKSIKARTNVSADIFCGSGDASSWSGGEAKSGTFTCGPVSFVISGIEAQDTRQQEATSQGQAAETQIETNERIRKAAEAKYGPRAGDYLGQQDTIQMCKDAGANCTVVIGGNVAVVPGDGAGQTQQP